MVLRLHQIVYAPFYALFIVGPTAMLIEMWLDSRRATGGEQLRERLGAMIAVTGDREAPGAPCALLHAAECIMNRFANRKPSIEARSPEDAAVRCWPSLLVDAAASPGFPGRRSSAVALASLGSNRVHAM